MSARHFVSGVFAGVAIGAAIGLLLAPTSGEKTRRKLEKGSRKLMNQLRHNVDGLKDKYNDGVDKIASRNKDGITTVREKPKM